MFDKRFNKIYCNYENIKYFVYNTLLRPKEDNLMSSIKKCIK